MRSLKGHRGTGRRTGIRSTNRPGSERSRREENMLTWQIHSGHFQYKGKVMLLINHWLIADWQSCWLCLIGSSQSVEVCSEVKWQLVCGHEVEVKKALINTVRVLLTVNTADFTNGSQNLDQHWFMWHICCHEETKWLSRKNLMHHNYFP